MLDYFITSLCFPVVVPIHLVVLNLCLKINIKHNCVALSNPVVIQEAGYVVQEWELAAVVYLEVSLSRASAQPCGCHFHEGPISIGCSPQTESPIPPTVRHPACSCG